MSLKKWSQQIKYPLPYCNAQTDPRNKIKTHPKKIFFFFDFYYYFSHTRVNFTFCLTCLILVWIPFKSRRPLYVLKEITKKIRTKEHKEIFRSTSKIFKFSNFQKHFMAHQYMHKIFHGPCKISSLPPYILNVLAWIKTTIQCEFRNNIQQTYCTLLWYRLVHWHQKLVVVWVSKFAKFLTSLGNKLPMFNKFHTCFAAFMSLIFSFVFLKIVYKIF